MKETKIRRQKMIRNLFENIKIKKSVPKYCEKKYNLQNISNRDNNDNKNKMVQTLFQITF